MPVARTLSVLGTLALVSGALVSCTAPAAPVELDFASYFGISPEIQAFIDEVQADNSITVTVDENWTVHHDGVEAIGDEVSVAKAVAAGDIDLAWSSTRVFPALGVDGFRAVEAPMLITSYAAERDVVSGETGAAILAGLGGSGVTGLSVFPGTLRSPVTTGHPLLDPADWAGKRVVYFHEPAADSVQAETIEALGGVPSYLGLHIIDDLDGGVVDAGTDSLDDLSDGGATNAGPFMTSNVVLWPTLSMLVANTERFAGLSESQRNTITAAARHLRDSFMTVGMDPSVVPLVCAMTKLAVATPEQLAALRTAVQPVYDSLEADPVEAPFLHQLEKIAAAHPDADVPSVPASCAWGP